MNESEETRAPTVAVRAVIVDEEGKVLVIRRAADSTEGGTWCLPGGKADYMESLEQALCREVHEETNLTCTNVGFIFYQDSLPLSDGAPHYVNMYFRCEATGTLKLNEESTEWRWIGGDELDTISLAFRHDDGLRRFWKTAR